MHRYSFENASSFKNPRGADNVRARRTCHGSRVSATGDLCRDNVARAGTFGKLRVIFRIRYNTWKRDRQILEFPIGQLRTVGNEKYAKKYLKDRKIIPSRYLHHAGIREIAIYGICKVTLDRHWGFRGASRIHRHDATRSWSTMVRMSGRAVAVYAEGAWTQVRAREPILTCMLCTICCEFTGLSYPLI